jgi:lysophospholipase L1-like esterase
MPDEKPAKHLRPPLNGSGVGDYTLRDFAARWMMQQEDIPDIAHYASDNALLRANTEKAPRIVAMGDSITEFWDIDVFGSGGFHFINRGIAGQNTSQMLLRFVDDVVTLRPRGVALLCGTNDLRAYVGDPAEVAASALARIRRNVTAMCDISRGNDIAVLLGAIPPVGADRERVARDSDAIRSANSWLKSFASSRGYPFADYYSALAGPDGHILQHCSDDGVHPNATGYGKMGPILDGALGALLHNTKIIPPLKVS